MPVDAALEGVGGGYEDVGDLKASLLPEKLLPVEGFDWKLSFEVVESSERVLFSALGGGLASIGVKAFKKSV